LYAEGFTPIESWGGGERGKDGIFPMPNYHRDVSEFFRIASNECWCDYDYDPGNARRMLENDDAVKAADLSQIKTMLTYRFRGERLPEGQDSKEARLISLIRPDGTMESEIVWTDRSETARVKEKMDRLIEENEPDQLKALLLVMLGEHLLAEKERGDQQEK